ncbi:BBP7 family outer membrane beta-barrel protein [Stieleria varia]|uniref:Legionella pneumophila major outer membrane protein n=1 Tax=Stieleria varia TaxID=2528005 RepID=A0A5C5ZYF4_9BACT|nr:BBP7 family outer membrane beta-barrel protein [Stieleria varia]TWT91981.1 hypothetical protein Pla52n_64540 [Stieleria varia]
MTAALVGATPAEAQLYSQRDLMFLSRKSGTFDFGTIGGNAVSAESSDTELGYRSLYGLPLNDTVAVEASYLGVWDWPESRTIVGGGSIVSDFTASGHGDSNVSTTLRQDASLHNVELNLRHNLRNGEGDQLDVLFGLNYTRFNEQFQIESTSIFGSDYTSSDTSNDFFGPQLGIQSAHQLGFFGLQLHGMTAIGGNSSRSQLRFTDTGHGNPAFDDTADASEFSVMLRGGVTGTAQLTERWALRAGYLVQAYSGFSLAGEFLSAQNATVQSFPAYQSISDSGTNSTLILHGGFLGLEYVLR